MADTTGSPHHSRSHEAVLLWVGGVHRQRCFCARRVHVHRLTPSYEICNRVLKRSQGRGRKHTDSHWAGDCVLGKYFAESRTSLTSAGPAIQGDYPGIVPYMGPDSRSDPPIEDNLWCTPAISYHHVDPSMIKDLWNFEQEQISLSENVSPTIDEEQ